MEYVEREVSAPLGVVKLAIVGDVQYGASACDVAQLERDADRIRFENALVIGVGDYIDLASPSNRARLANAGMYDTPADALEEAADRAVDGFLYAMRGTTWLVAVAGHHYYPYLDGTTSDLKVADGLGAKFGGDSALLRLRIKPAPTTAIHFVDGVRVPPDEPDFDEVVYNIHVHHGSGSGVAGSALRHLFKTMSCCDADMYVCGHFHSKEVSERDEPYFDHEGIMQHHAKVLACAGGYLKGYMQGHSRGLVAQGTYVEKAMLPPVALGALFFTLRVADGKVTVEGGL